MAKNYTLKQLRKMGYSGIGYVPRAYKVSKRYASKKAAWAAKRRTEKKFRGTTYLGDAIFWGRGRPKTGYVLYRFGNKYSVTDSPRKRNGSIAPKTWKTTWRSLPSSVKY